MRPLQGAEGDAVAPGAKVLIAGASIKAGIVLVDSRSLKVLLTPPSSQDDNHFFVRLHIAGAAQSGPGQDAIAQPLRTSGDLGSHAPCCRFIGDAIQTSMYRGACLRKYLHLSSPQAWHQILCHCLKLLGGRVEELYEAWDFQRRFGSGVRPAAEPADAAEGDKPPQFKTFVPGKTRVPKRALAPAEVAPNSHRCLHQSAHQHDGCMQLPSCSACCHCCHQLPRCAC